MQHHVIVHFGRDRTFEFKFSDSVAADEARKWFEREFTALECDVATPTGKILVVDRILSVARYAGEGRFAAGAWGELFARNAAGLLGRELIRVDVEQYSIGY